MTSYDIEDILSQEYLIVSSNHTVGEVIKEFKDFDYTDKALYYIYTKDDGDFVNVFSIKELLKLDENIVLDDLERKDLEKVRVNDTPHSILEKFADTDLQALPVIEDECLKGVIRADDMLELIEEETSEDILKQAGISSKEYRKSSHVLNTSILEAVRIRLPWLLFALGGGMVAGGVIEGFEGTLQNLVVLAFFIPVIMDMGGNVGTQSSTIFVRGLVLGQIDSKHFYRRILREGLVGSIIGLITGLIAALISFAWQGNLLVSTVLLISMVLTCFLASVIGYIIPFTAHKLDYDPASVSDPLVTTVKDVTALLIYFSIASLLLSI